MRATDLMIGDWVLFNGNPKKVTSLLVTDLGVDQIYVFGKSCQVATISEYIEPIPLTAEILEKIGFQQRNGYYNITIEDKDTRYCMEYDILSGKLTINNTWFVMNKVSYVHKLQHALKLCGIDKEICSHFKPNLNKDVNS